MAEADRRDGAGPKVPPLNMPAITRAPTDFATNAMSKAAKRRETYVATSNNLGAQFNRFFFVDRKAFCCCFGSVAGAEALEVVVLHMPILMVTTLGLLTTPQTFLLSALIRAYASGYCTLISLAYLLVALAAFAKENGARAVWHDGVRTGFRQCCTFRRVAAALHILSIVSHLAVVFSVLPVAASIGANLTRAFGDAKHLPDPTSVPFDFGQWLTQQLGSHEGNTPANRHLAEMARSVVVKNLTEIQPPVPEGTYANYWLMRGRSDAAWTRQVRLKYVLPSDVVKKSSSGGALPPVLFHVHGGAWKYGDAFVTLPKVAYYLKRGYAVASMEYRLLGYGYNCMAMYEDIRDGLDYVKKHGRELGMDPDRVVMYGESAGGHLALLTAYRYNLDARSSTGVLGVFNMQGAVDFVSFVRAEYTNGDSYHRILSYLMANTASAPSASTTALSASKTSLKERTLDDDAEAYRMCSPSYWISVYAPPTFSVHGSLDSLIPVAQTERLHNLLEEASSKDGRPIPHLKAILPMHDHIAGAGWAGAGSQVTRYAAERFFAWAVERPMEAPSSNATETAIPYLQRMDDDDAAAARARSDTDEPGMKCAAHSDCASGLILSFTGLISIAALVLFVKIVRKRARERREADELAGKKSEPWTLDRIWREVKFNMRRFLALLLAMFSGKHDFDEFINKNANGSSPSTPRGTSFWGRDKTALLSARDFANTYIEVHGVRMPISVAYTLGESVEALERLAKERQIEPQAPTAVPAAVQG